MRLSDQWGSSIWEQARQEVKRHREDCAWYQTLGTDACDCPVRWARLLLMMRRDLDETAELVRRESERLSDVRFSQGARAFQEELVAKLQSLIPQFTEAGDPRTNNIGALIQIVRMQPLPDRPK